MATVTITITDAPGGVTLMCESKNPPIPMNGHDPDMDETTPAQAVALGALMELCAIVGGEHFDWRVLLRD